MINARFQSRRTKVAWYNAKIQIRERKLRRIANFVAFVVERPFHYIHMGVK